MSTSQKSQRWVSSPPKPRFSSGHHAASRTLVVPRVCAGGGVLGLHQEAPFRGATSPHTNEEDSLLPLVTNGSMLSVRPVTIPCHSMERWFWFWVVRELRRDGDLAPAAVRGTAQKWFGILF